MHRELDRRTLLLSVASLAACQGVETQTKMAGSACIDLSRGTGEASVFAQFDEELATVQHALLSHEPEQATLLGFSDKDAGDGYLSRWGAYGEAGRRERRGRLEAVAGVLRGFDPERLDPTRRMTRDVLLDRASGWLDLEEACGVGGLSPWGVIWGYELYPVNQISGFHIGAPSLLINQQPLASPEDAETYLARLAGMADALDAVGLEARVDAQRFPVPSRIVAGAIAVVEDFVAPAGRAHPLAASFAARLEAGSIAGGDRFADRAERILLEEVYPAYHRLRTVLLEIQKTGQEALGLASRARGDELYQAFLHMQADTALTAAEIHAIGRQETERLASQLDSALRAVGLATGPIQARLADLSTRPGQLYANSAEGREALLADLRKMVAQVNERMLIAFDGTPQRPAEIRPVPSFLDKYASGGGGQPPAMNGRTPGVFTINLREMENTPLWGLPALAFHEATPGHIYEGEVAMARELPALRVFLARSNAFAEGWAMYSEQLASELGLYAPYVGGEIGRLKSELFRANRLVVDTGLHALGWSFEEGVRFMFASCGATEDEARREVVRYAAWPGQAVGYKLGMIEILKARDRARAALGERFSLKGFHRTLLETGGVPLPFLTRSADCWAAAA